VGQDVNLMCITTCRCPGVEWERYKVRLGESINIIMMILRGGKVGLHFLWDW